MTDLAASFQSRRSVRKFTSDELARADIEALVHDATWSPSGGNSQPWSIVALAPARAHELLSRYEKRMWDTLLPRVIHMQGATKEDCATQVPRARAAIRHDVLVEGRPWLLFVWSTHVPVEPELVARVHEALGSEAPSLRVMQHVSGELDEGVTAASTLGFAYGLTLLAHDRGWGACLQSSWLAFANELEAELPAPVPGARLAIAVMVGRTDRTLPARPRRPVPMVWHE